jgi:hypothetical protein
MVITTFLFSLALIDTNKPNENNEMQQKSLKTNLNVRRSNL